jgi:hypothetical protein
MAATSDLAGAKKRKRQGCRSNRSETDNASLSRFSGGLEAIETGILPTVEVRSMTHPSLAVDLVGALEATEAGALPAVEEVS